VRFPGALAAATGFVLAALVPATHAAGPSFVLQYQVTGLPQPTAIALSPPGVTLGDTSSAGTPIAVAIVTMSDGSQFHGTLTTDDPGFFAISGNTIVTARQLNPADDGTHHTIITASNP
jgi:hypothetical protein